jgi:CIC family chloride channel protein
VPARALAVGPGVGVTALPWFLLLGLVIGGAAWVLTRGIYWFEDRFNAMPGNDYTRHLAGMLLVGALFLGFMSFSSPWFGQPNHYYVQGVGYATIMDILEGRQTAVLFLVVLAAAKVLATCLTLGSGASGGVFSPGLFVGATLGGALGSLLGHIVPDFPVGPAQFAYAGMAAMIAGTTGAAVTGTIMVFEMTRDYAGILPVILTVALATAVRSRLEPSTIYTLKLIRRGHVVPQGLQAWTGQLRSRDVMTPDFLVLPREGGIEEDVVDDALRQGRVVVILGKEGQIQGIIDRHSRFESGMEPATPHVVVAADLRMEELLRTMERSGARIAVVSRSLPPLREGDVLGVITEGHITRVARTRAELSD